MDPLTQGVVGAAFAQLKSNKMNLGTASVIGALAGMAADLDILIRSSTDPLLKLQFHRHFTHSYIFVPIGALLCATVFFYVYVFWKNRRNNALAPTPLTFQDFYIWSFLGYGTHAALDVCTSYGTQIYWPFSDHRATIDIISVIDPLFTLPCLLLIWLAVHRSNRVWLAAAFMWGAVYLSLGYLQRERAEALANDLALTRGHTANALTVKPSFANLFVWKSIYEFDGRFYVDAVKPGINGDRVWAGESVEKLNIARDFPWLTHESQQYKDILRFAWFSSGYVGIGPEGSNRVEDIRYSLVPNQIRPLWGIELNENAHPDQHVEHYMEHKGRKHAISTLWKMIWE